MAKPDTSIDSRLLESAKAEFLECGFGTASLKTICKNAGITTGALYKRYKGKEDLFCTTVADSIAQLNDFVDGKTSINEENLSDSELIAAWDMNEEAVMRWYKFLFSIKESFILLIHCAAGTKYENFQHDWVEVMTDKTYCYYTEARKRGLVSAEITKVELHILLTAFWSTIYEPFIHGYTWEQILDHSRIVCKLFDWHRVLGFKQND